MAADEMMIEMLSGQGNLDARVLWAALAGKYRVAHGEKKAYTVQQNNAIQIANNFARRGVYMFVGVSLPLGAATNPVSMLFSSEERIGFNTSVPVRLTDSMGQGDVGAPAVSGGAFFAILQPEDQLFAQLPAGALTSAQILVSRVSF